MQTNQENVNTSSGIPVQMVAPQLSVQAQTQNMNTQRSLPYSVMYPTLSMAQAPLQHQMQTIQQNMNTNSEASVQMVLPEQLSAQEDTAQSENAPQSSSAHQTYSTMTISQSQMQNQMQAVHQNISAESGAQVQMVLPEMNAQAQAVQSGVQGVQSISQSSSNPQTIMYPSTMTMAQQPLQQIQVIQQPLSTPYFQQVYSPQQTMFFPSNMTYQHTGGTTIQSIGPAQGLQLQTSKNSFNGQTFQVINPVTKAFANQTLLSKPVYSSTVPVNSQASSGNHLKQVISQPQVLGSFSALPQGLTLATPGSIQASSFLNPNSIIQGQQQPEIIFQSSPQTAMFLQGTTPPGTVYTILPQRRITPRVRYRFPVAVTAVQTNTINSKTDTAERNKLPIPRYQIRPKGKITLFPYTSAITQTSTASQVTAVAQLPQATLPTQVLQTTMLTQIPQATLGVQIPQANVGAQTLQANVGAQTLQANVGAQTLQTNVGAQTLQANVGAQTLQANVGAQTLQTNIEVQTLQASVESQTSQASVKAQTPRGSMEIQMPQASIEVQTPQASIEVQTPQASVEAQSPQASVEAQTPQASVEVQTPQASVEAQTPQASVEAQTPQASVEAQTPQARVEVQTSQTAFEAQISQATVEKQILQTTVETQISQTAETQTNQCQSQLQAVFVSHSDVANHNAFDQTIPVTSEIDVPPSESTLQTSENVHHLTSISSSCNVQSLSMPIFTVIAPTTTTLSTTVAASTLHTQASVMSVTTSNKTLTFPLTNHIADVSATESVVIQKEPVECSKDLNVKSEFNKQKKFLQKVAERRYNEIQRKMAEYEFSEHKVDSEMVAEDECINQQPDSDIASNETELVKHHTDPIIIECESIKQQTDSTSIPCESVENKIDSTGVKYESVKTELDSEKVGRESNELQIDTKKTDETEKIAQVDSVKDPYKPAFDLQSIIFPPSPTVEKKRLKAIVRPHILTHVIDGFVIYESSEPFPVSKSALMSEPPKEVPKREDKLKNLEKKGHKMPKIIDRKKSDEIKKVDKRKSWESKRADRRKSVDLKKTDEIKPDEIKPDEKKPDEPKKQDKKNPDEPKKQDKESSDEPKMANLKNVEESIAMDPKNVNEPKQMDPKNVKKPKEMDSKNVEEPKEMDTKNVKKPKEMDSKNVEEPKDMDPKKTDEPKRASLRKPSESPATSDVPMPKTPSKRDTPDVLLPKTPGKRGRKRKVQNTTISSGSKEESTDKQQSSNSENKEEKQGSRISLRSRLRSVEIIEVTPAPEEKTVNSHVEVNHVPVPPEPPVEKFEPMTVEKVEPIDEENPEENFTQKLPTSWSVQDVYKFVKDIPSCADYAEEFRSQEIDGKALLLLKVDHIVTFTSMKFGPAIKLISLINNMKEKYSLEI